VATRSAQAFGLSIEDVVRERGPLTVAAFMDLALYDPEFGTRMRGTGPYADLLAQRFRKACARLGLDRRLPPLDTTSFRRPRQADDPQKSLFGD